MNKAESRIGYSFSEKLVATFLPVNLRQLESWEVIELQKRDMLEKVKGSNKKIRTHINNYISDYLGSVSTFSFWKMWGNYESVDDDLMAYSLVRDVEVDFYNNIDELDEKLASFDWDARIVSMQSRIIGDVTAHSLLERSRKMKGPIIENLRMSARRVFHWGAERTEEVEGVILDRGWINSLGMKLLNGESLSPNERDKFDFKPPVVASNPLVR